MAIPVEQTDDRPTSVAYISGRVWYGFKDRIFYSQVLEQDQYFMLERCYQKNDPTSETNSDSYPTDGGVIPIDGASKINSITPFRGGAFVTATNGVWFISGSNGVFTSDDFTVVKLSDDGCIAPQSVVSSFSTILYWGTSAIYMTSVNEYGETSVTAISKGTIQSFFDSVSKEGLKHVEGVVNKAKKHVEWLIPTGNDKNQKCCSLVLDLNTESFWVNDYEYMGLFKLFSAYPTPSTSKDDSVVYVTPKITADQQQNLGLEICISTMTNSEFKDCGTLYKTAYIDTAPVNLGKLANSKSAPAVAVQFRRTEENKDDNGYDFPSSCFLSAKWDYNNTGSASKWQSTQQAYRLKNYSTTNGAVQAEDVIYYKARIRGRGKAVTLRFEQEQGKDFQLLGYSVDYQMKSRM